jgi:hypothetical protein
MASKTFGSALYVYDTTYKLVGGLIDVTWPTYKADEPIDCTSHDSASGVREYIDAGTKDHTDFSFEANDLPSDAAQVFLRANVGTVVRFKHIKAASATARFVNAIVLGVQEGQNPVNGKATISVSCKPTGVDPTS